MVIDRHANGSFINRPNKQNELCLIKKINETQG